METIPQNPDFRDWLILDALSDDYESVEQIVALVHDQWPEVSAIEVIDRLEQLYSAEHVFLTLGATFDRAGMVREITDSSSRRFWFGRAPSGDTLWRHTLAPNHALQRTEAGGMSFLYSELAFASLCR